jgi:hypothetical protein
VCRRQPRSTGSKNEDIKGRRHHAGHAIGKSAA